MANFGNFNIYDTDFGKFLLRPDDLVSNELINNRFWEKELLPVFDRLDSYSVVIEVGSYVGDHTVYLSKKCKQVYAVEPNVPSYYQLCANLLLNNCFNVEVWCECIGMVDDTVRIASEKMGDEWFPKIGNIAGTRFVIDNRHGDRKCISLDELFYGWTDYIDYLKVDAEGMDLDVLMGAETLIKCYHPMITFEFNELISRYPYKDYENFLQQYEYKVTRIGEYNWLAER